jgi:parallel beta-helix repeat protein
VAIRPHRVKRIFNYILFFINKILFLIRVGDNVAVTIYNTPSELADEVKMLEELSELGSKRTHTGRYAFTSFTSNTTYDTRDSLDENVLNKGQDGMYYLLSNSTNGILHQYIIYNREYITGSMSAQDVIELQGKINTFEQALNEGTLLTGKSAYEIAVDNGFIGTEVEWLESLKGDTNINVETFGAKGDGVTDDTVAIQNALNYATTHNGTVMFQNKVYMIDASIGILPQSNTTLLMNPNTILRAIPNNLTHYTILLIYNQVNVIVRGGVIQGERNSHIGTTGEWGHGLVVRGDCQNILIDNVLARDCWGDGFEVRYGESGDKSQIPFNVIIRNCIGDNNRRQGLSIICGKNVIVDGCTFKNTNGTLPECGIDVETDFQDDITTVQDIRITNCYLENNNGWGLSFAYSMENIASGNTIVGNKCGGIYCGRSSKLLIQNNIINSNGGDTSINYYGNGIYLNYTDYCQILNNCLLSNTLNGIQLLNGISNNSIIGNKLVSNGDSGINIYGSASIDKCLTILSNTCLSNTKYGIIISNLANSLFSNNVSNLNGYTGLSVYTVNNSVLSSNNSSSNGRDGIVLNTVVDSNIENNNISGNGTSVSNNYSNMWLRYSSLTNIISGNICRQGTNINLPKYGISIDSGCNDNILINNDISNSGVTTDYLDSGTGNRGGGGVVTYQVVTDKATWESMVSGNTTTPNTIYVWELL